MPSQGRIHRPCPFARPVRFSRPVRRVWLVSARSMALPSRQSRVLLRTMTFFKNGSSTKQLCQGIYGSTNGRKKTASSRAESGRRAPDLPGPDYKTLGRGSNVVKRETGNQGKGRLAGSFSNLNIVG